MKAITLHQPYATLIANGTKRYETRSWAPPRSLLGMVIAIHASKRKDPAVRQNCVRLTAGATDATCDEYSGRAGECIVTWKARPDPYHAPELLDACYPLGEVVATAVLSYAGYVQHTAPDAGEYGQVLLRSKANPDGAWIGRIIDVDPYGDYSAGRWVWELTDVQPVSPSAPARGYQGFWNWEPPRED